MGKPDTKLSGVWEGTQHFIRQPQEDCSLSFKEDDFDLLETQLSHSIKAISPRTIQQICIPCRAVHKKLVASQCAHLYFLRNPTTVPFIKWLFYHQKWFHMVSNNLGSTIQFSILSSVLTDMKNACPLFVWPSKTCFWLRKRFVVPWQATRW